MGAGHAHQLYRPGDSPVHRLPPHCKLPPVLAFVVVVVSTPRERFWAFGLYAPAAGRGGGRRPRARRVTRCGGC